MSSAAFESLHIPHLYEVVVFLVASVVIVPLFRALRASPVLGFLFAGLLIGPYGLGVIRDVESVAAFAELGVVFLLFTIGLELSWERLRALRTLVFGLGTTQVALSSLAMALALYASGIRLEAAAVLAMSASLSSTAVVVQLLVERHELTTRFGRATFAVLLLQDLAVVPILVLVTIFSQGQGNVALGLLQALLRGGLTVASIVVVGRWGLRPLFRIIAGTQSAELFMAAILLAILGIGSVTALAGLSMALGAFLAGLLLAETAFRHQIEIDIQPFRGLLLGLFFISVGMQLDTTAMLARPLLTAGAVVALLALKAATTTAAALAFVDRGTAVRLGLMLAPGGEFAFVAGGLAMSTGVVPAELGQLVLIVITLSMALAPACASAGAGLERWLAVRATLPLNPAAVAHDLERHVVIAGFGRVGQMVAKLLELQGISYVAIDLDARRVAAMHRTGTPVWYGDASRADVLTKVGAERAALAVVTFGDPETSLRAIQSMRREWPDLHVFARARDTAHAQALGSHGASMIVAEFLESSLQLSAHVLAAMGTPRDEIDRLLDDVRLEHYGGMLEYV